MFYDNRFKRKLIIFIITIVSFLIPIYLYICGDISLLSLISGIGTFTLMWIILIITDIYEKNLIVDFKISQNNIIFIYANQKEYSIPITELKEVQETKRYYWYILKNRQKPRLRTKKIYLDPYLEGKGSSPPAAWKIKEIMLVCNQESVDIPIEEKAYLTEQLNKLKEILSEQEARLKQKGFVLEYFSYWQDDMEKTFSNGYVQVDVRFKDDNKWVLHYRYCICENAGNDEASRNAIETLIVSIREDLSRIEEKGYYQLRKIKSKQITGSRRKYYEKRSLSKSRDLPSMKRKRMIWRIVGFIIFLVLTYILSKIVPPLMLRIIKP